MSIARYPLALGFFFTSLLAVSVEARTTEIPLHFARAADLEATLASKREAYLVVDVQASRLDVRVRGVTLESHVLESVGMFERRRSIEARTATGLELPRVFTVSATISLLDRKVIAHEKLQPWTNGSEPEVAAGDGERRATPASYDAPLEGGWTLEVRQRGATASGTSRFIATVADGWSHLVGDGDRDRRPTLRLVMNGEGAMKLHHLLVKGAAILVVSGAHEEPPPATPRPPAS